MAKDPVLVVGKTYYINLQVNGKTIEVVFLGKAKNPKHNHGSVVRIVKIHGKASKNDLRFYKSNSTHVIATSLLSETKP